MNQNYKEVQVLRPYQSPRSKGTNSRRHGTNPRSKGNNKRVNEFLANVIAIASIKEQRPLTDYEINQFTQATIDFFVSKYESRRRVDHGNLFR